MFKGGKYRTVTIAATAGNATRNMAPGLNKAWYILRGTITLVNDGTVATRNLRIRITDGSNVTEWMYKGSNTTASQTKYHSVGLVSQVANGSQDTDYVGISEPILIVYPDQFRITVDSGVAGDNVSGFLVVWEFDY